MLLAQPGMLPGCVCNAEGLQSCSSDFDQPALLQIRQNFAYIRSERVRVRLVFFGQFADDLAQYSSVAAGKNFVRSFVKFDNTFGVKQHVFTRG